MVSKSLNRLLIDVSGREPAYLQELISLVADYHEEQNIPDAELSITNMRRSARSVGNLVSFWSEIEWKKYRESLSFWKRFKKVPKGTKEKFMADFEEREKQRARADFEAALEKEKN